MLVTETTHKMTMWEDHDSDTWSTRNFEIADETLGAMRVKLEAMKNDFPDWFPNQVAGLHRWEVLLTVDGDHYRGVVTNTHKNIALGEIYLTVSVSGY